MLMLTPGNLHYTALRNMDSLEKKHWAKIGFLTFHFPDPVKPSGRPAHPCIRHAIDDLEP